MPDDPQSPGPRDSSLPQPPSPDPGPSQGSSDLLPSPEKSPPVPQEGSVPSARQRLPSLGDDELIADKKKLVAAFDQIVEPLNQILGLMRHAWRGGVILLAFMALMVAVQVHTTLRMVVVQEQLAEVVTAQKALQQTATTVADKQTATQDALNQQSQITIEPSVTPDGSPTAIVVVKPPPASSTLPAIPLPLAPPTAATFGSAKMPKSGGAKHPAPSATAAVSVDANAPPAAPAPAAIKFE